MASFEITTPDGKKYNVSGENQAGALAALRTMLRDQANPSGAETNGSWSEQPRAYDILTEPATSKSDVFGDTIAATTKRPLEALSAFAGGIAEPNRSVTQSMLPKNMDPQLKGRLGFMGDVLGTGLTTLGVGISGVAGLVGETLGGSPSNERKLASDLMAASEVAIPELAGYSSTYQATRRAIKAADALSNGPKTPLQASARAADDLGILPSLGAGGKGRAMTAAALEKVPFSGSVIADDASRFVGDVEQVAARITGTIGKARTPAEAGDLLQGGLSKFTTRFRARSNELYANVAKQIPGTTLVQAEATTDAIRDAIAPFSNKPALMQQLGLNKWAAIADDLKTGLSWRAASDLRTSIGESIGKISGELASLDQGKLKMAYARLTDDLAAAAKAAGPRAEAAWKRAGAHYRAGARRIEGSLDQTISAKSPERAFEAFAAMTKEGRASSDVKRMLAIRKSVGKREWRDISASIIDRLGQVSAGRQNAIGDVFSPAAFLTEWNKMSLEARRILLPENIRIELNKLAKVAEISKVANAERNFSNTGTVVSAVATATAVANAPIATAAALGGAWSSSKLLTTAHTLRALNKWARGDARQLTALANGRGPFAQDAATVLRLSASETAASPRAANNRVKPQNLIAAP